MNCHIAFRLCNPQPPAASTSAPTPWKKIWTFNVPPKVKHFLWRALKSALPIQESLHRRGILVATNCIHCGAFESLTHAFLDCPFVKAVWFGSPLGIRPLPNTIISVSRWFWHMYETLPRADLEAICMIMWRIWGCRNSKLYENTSLSAVEVSLSALKIL